MKLDSLTFSQTITKVMIYICLLVMVVFTVWNFVLSFKKKKNSKLTIGTRAGLILFVFSYIAIFSGTVKGQHMTRIYGVIVVGLYVLVAFILDNRKIKEQKVEQMSDACFRAWVSHDIAIADETDTINTFLASWKLMGENLETAKRLSKETNTNDSSIQELERIYTQHYQWQLRNAIEREKNSSISCNKNQYKNSHSHRCAVYSSYCKALMDCRDTFTPETLEFAIACADELYSRSSISCEKISIAPEYTDRGFGLSVDSSYNEVMSEVDTMDGHQFEEWCQKLLVQNGFSNVRVTGGSGDQGVDVLAEKGGIRYAIQCKCYSSDLGNTPVQEVHTGKDIYNCHVGVVMTNRYFTEGGKEAARRTNTLLWDRDTLNKMISN